VVALAGTMKSEGGLWIGTRDPEDEGSGGSGLNRQEGDDFARLTMSLTPEEYEGYYLGHANSVLWPLLHSRPDVVDMRLGNENTYVSANARLARLAVPHLLPSDTIWIHDYHLIPLASALRAEGVRNPIGFFLHTPFPESSCIKVLPDRETFLGWFADYDLVGLQTARDVTNFLSAFRSMGAAEIISNGRIRWRDRMIAVASFPISIDPVACRELAETHSPNFSRMLPPYRLMLGVDRLDYTKGIPQRLRGLQIYLRQNPDPDDRISFVQIAPPTREDLHAYKEIRRELEQLSGEVNGEFSDIGFVPVHYIHRAIPRASIAGLLRLADIALVTPLNDGMNLVAKEFIASQDPEKPGVLILSRFAGAAEQLEDGALIVNPYDPDSIAAAIGEAVHMPMEERRPRHARLWEGLVARDGDWWTQTYLKSLAAMAADRQSLEGVLDTGQAF
jgi:trehalose 6-phosphate synthase